MFKPGDLVRPRMDSPKLRIAEVNDDRTVAVQASNESDDKFTLKAADIT